MINGFFLPQALALFFIFFGLTIAVIIRQLRKRFSLIPYAPTLFFISMALGYFSPYMGLIGDSVLQISKADPRGILIIFLPPLIFQSSYNSDWYIFRKQAGQIFFLAFPAVFLSALFIMLSVIYIVRYGQEYYTGSEAFMFGSVLSCTDTVAVLALLKEAGAPRKFSSLIQGQSLFNDGTCMVLFTISIELVLGDGLNIGMVGLFFQLTLGAIILGIIFGFLSSYIIGKVSNNTILTLNITVVSSYIIYFVAEYVDLGIKISGIMSLVSLGLYMAAFGKNKISTECKYFVDNFWKVYVFVAQTIIFILGGVMVGTQALNPKFVQVISVTHLWKLLLLYLCMMLSRFLSIALLMPRLKVMGYGLKWKQVIALTYGGLRGAVGIAFTLILSSNQGLRQNFKTMSLYNTSGCAILTLLINAPTASFVVKKLGLCVKSEIQTKIFRKFMRQTYITLDKSLREDMKKDKYLKNSQWDKVICYSGLEELEKLNKNDRRQKSQKQMRQINSRGSLKEIILRQTLFDQQDPATIQQIRHRFCLVLKGIIMDKFERNQCISQTIKVLIECVNLDMDSINQPLNSWDYILLNVENFHLSKYFYFLKNQPIVGAYIHSVIYDKVGELYDLISTYLQAMKQAEQACRQFPFGANLQNIIIEESQQNRKLAKIFLDYEIKISYEQIMKRIQTTKAAFLILTYQKQILLNAYQFGEIDDNFYKKLQRINLENMEKLQSDSLVKQPMKDIDFLKASQFFKQLSQQQLNIFINKKTQFILQKDQPIVKSYEKHKCIYLVTRGEIKEQYYIDKKVCFSQNVGLYKLSGVGAMLNQNKKIQYYATAASKVTIFGFLMSDIKDLISKNPKLQNILYIDTFMINIKIHPNIAENFWISQKEWYKKKHQFIFKQLKTKEQEEYQSGKIFLLNGKIIFNDKQRSSGFFEIKQKVIVSGPAKFYYTSTHLKVDEDSESHRDSQGGDLFRNSLKQRLSTVKQNNDDIIRRTIFTKD